MSVESENSVAVVDQDGTARKKEALGQNDFSRGGGMDPGSHLGAKVQAAVKALHLPVEETLGSEMIGDLRVERKMERAGPIFLGGDLGVELTHQALLFADS